LIELPKAEAVALVLPEKNGSDEESRNHEKDIDANESTGQPFPFQVEDEDREDCDCPQTIYGGTVLDDSPTLAEKQAGKFTSGENFISISHQGWLKFPLEFSPSSL